MPGVTVEVESRIVGARRDAPALDTVLLDLLDERITVAELIRRTVEEQVHDLLIKRKMDAEEARGALDRQYMTPQEVLEQAQKGAVRFPSKRVKQVPQIDAQAEVKKALGAFKAGAYFVMIDGRQVERLDEEITFAPGTKVTFLRLTPLVGG